MVDKEERIGKLFDARTEDRVGIKAEAHRLCKEYNELPEDDPKRWEIGRKLLGKTGEDFYMQGPIQFNYGKNTTIGEMFFSNFNFTVLDDGPITIGDHVMIGPNVSLMSSSHPLIWKEREEMTYPDGHTGMSEYAPPIVIEDHVWIACGAIICGGVTIGEGSVIGAGSVVVKDIPAGVLAVGNPCKPIRKITEADSKMDLL